jgi:hypothetical protein
MSLKKKLVLLALVLGIGAASAVAFWPEEAEALNCYRCRTFWNTTPGQWGMGSTCAEAEANAIANAEGYAYGLCDVCDIGASAIVTPCNFSGGMWKADATIQYRCAVDLCQ